MMSYSRITLLVFCLSQLMLLPGLVLAAGGGGSGTRVQRIDPNLEKAQLAIEVRQWDRAIDLLNRAASNDSQNAEVHNLLGFTERKRGNLETAFTHYQRALTLDPKHRGAHEYLGETYLLVGNLAKAEEQLAALDKLCFFSCEEYRDLKKAIADYRKQHPQ